MAIPSVLYLYPGNDQYIELDGLCDATDVTNYINGATGTATLYDNTGAQVSGASSLAFSYAPSSNGVYRVTVPGTFSAPVGTGYTLKIDISYSSAVLHLEIPVQVKVRSSL